MKYKSVEEMNMKNYKNNNIITKEQEEWIDFFKRKIKAELDWAYENNPSIGYVQVNININEEMLNNVDSKEYFNKIEMVRYDLVKLGYIVDFEFIYDRLNKTANGLIMTIEWSV